MDREFGRIKPVEAQEFETLVPYIKKETVEIDKETKIFFRVVVNLETKGGPRIATSFSLHHLGEEKEENNPLENAMKAIIAFNELTKLMTADKVLELVQAGASIHFNVGSGVQFYVWSPLAGKLQAVGMGGKVVPLKDAKHIEIKIDRPMTDHIDLHSKNWFTALLRKILVGAVEAGPTVGLFWSSSSGVLSFLQKGTSRDDKAGSGIGLFWSIAKGLSLLYEPVGIYTYSKHATRAAAYFQHKLDRSSASLSSIPVFC